MEKLGHDHVFSIVYQAGFHIDIRNDLKNRFTCKFISLFRLVSLLAEEKKRFEKSFYLQIHQFDSTDFFPGLQETI